MADEGLTYAEYHAQIAAIADSILGDWVLKQFDALCAGRDVQSLRDMMGYGALDDVEDALADHEYIIYTHHAKRVLDHSPNDDAIFERDDPLANAQGWSDVYTMAASEAMAFDLSEALQEIVTDEFALDEAEDDDFFDLLRERWQLYEEFETGTGSTLLILEISGRIEGHRVVALLYKWDDDEEQYDVACFDAEQAVQLASTLALELIYRRPGPPVPDEPEYLQVGRGQAEEAIDQQSNFPSWADAYWAYYANVEDTIRENGGGDAEVGAALREYVNEIQKHMRIPPLRRR